MSHEQRAHAPHQGALGATLQDPAWMSRERSRLVLDSVRDYAIFTLDARGHILDWNPGAERIEGYKAEEVIGKHLSLFYPPEEVLSPKWERELEIAREEGRYTEEGWRVRKDGSRFWASVTLSAMREKSGELVGFVKVMRDMTARHEEETRLQESEERFRLLIASIKDYAVFMLQPTGHVATWNPGAERLKGYRAEEIIGQHISRFYDPEDVRRGRPQALLREAELNGRVEDEGWRVRKDGTRFWADVVISAVRDHEGRLRGFSKVTRDLTERRKLEEERLRAAQAQEAVRLRDEFLSIASHELKTPLTALQLQLHSMRERMEALDQRTATRLDRASRSSERLADLIEALLDVSRISTGRLDLSPQRFDLAETVHEVTERMRDSAVKAGCELSLRVEAPLPGTWDHLRLEQVLVNLVGNAIKYAAGAPIEVSLTREGGTAILEVRDHGPGISEEALPRIFNRFERASEMRHYGGLGLGLYIVREIVKAHDGMVTVRNLPEGGACFTARLPVVPATSPRAESSRPGDSH